MQFFYEITIDFNFGQLFCGGSGWLAPEPCCLPIGPPADTLLVLLSVDMLNLYPVCRGIDSDNFGVE